MAWTEEKIELLKKLYAEDLSSEEISREIGDVTRNAVAGKVHRLGLSARDSRTRANRKRRAKIPKPKPKPVVPEPIVVKEATLPDGDYATVMTITGVMCRWPIGTPGDDDFHFCGNRIDGKTPYCETHANMAYQPSRNNENRTGTSQGSKELVDEMMQ